MCGGFVGDVLDTVGDAVGDVGDFVGDTVEWAGDTVGNVVEGVMEGDLKTIALVTAAAISMQPELLAELGVSEAAAASMMAEDAASLAAQGLTEAQIAETLATSYGIDSAAAAQIAGTSTGAITSDVALEQLGELAPEATGGLESVAEPGFDTQIFDDGSTMITDSTGNVIGGTDALGDTFTVEGGVGTYTGTGEGLGGTPETNFGGGLADPSDVQALLDYNAGLATGTPSLSDLQRAQNIARNLLGTGATAPATGAGGTTVVNVSTPASAPAHPTMPNLTGETTKANTNYALTGMPTFDDSAKIYKAEGGLSFPVYAEGGEVQDHNPEFFSEGGLSIAHRYVKGDGDGTSDSVPAMLATGEFVIPADVVSGLGNGDNDSGAQILDEFLKAIRSHKRSTGDSELPPDSKGPLDYLQEAEQRVA